MNNIVWKGMKGFAFVYLEMEPGGSEEALCSKLQGLQIGDIVLNVELDRKHHPQHKDSGKTELSVYVPCNYYCQQAPGQAS